MYVAFTLECLEDFSSLCEEEEERFRSITEILEKTIKNNDKIQNEVKKGKMKWH